ncbi:MAG: thiolase family protein [Atopobium sp.]|uniref:thiolase family protein n=1 Tax=Atopobium sp. TaxID=1872650 RepID=UPI002A753A1D|nr:thiolase family protein [Atopobium sp.]MDY2789078.1 thiolase family protein [Atopobium sp.]
MVKLGKNARSVSIVGVGCTPFTNFEDDPRTQGIGEGEAFGYAALEALEDCGLQPRDIDFFFHGSANPFMIGACLTPNMQVADWIGMRGKASTHHSEACCTGYVAIEEAVMAVASGAYDTVLTGCVDLAATLPVDDAPAHMRKDFPLEVMLPSIGFVYDRAYGRPLDSAFGISFDNWLNKYALDFDLSDDQVDAALNAVAKSMRHAAINNPLAFYDMDFDQIAKANGMKNADQFLTSMMNPKVTQFLRVTGFETKCDGAAAAILMPTEKAKALGLPAVEVLGTGAAAYEGATLLNEYNGTKDATKQVYELTGVTPDEIDLMYVNDFFMAGDIAAPEEVGYIPRGEAWQYALDGRLDFTGNKPVNPNGGRCSFGHAHGASGLADVYDAVKQMRGEAGATQVKKLPETTFLRGFGGGQNVRCQILRTVR